jgi:glutamate dehydrogenase
MGADEQRERVAHDTTTGTTTGRADHETAADETTARICETVAQRTGDRAPLATTFARATLRRVPPATLVRADEDVAASWLADAFAWMDDAPEDGVSVRLWTPTEGVDGRGPGGTVVEVAGEDRPFLLSTVSRTIESCGASVVRRLHPILGARRDAEGHLVEVGAARHADRRETFMHLELDRVLAADEVEELRERLAVGLEDVRRVTEDHDRMRTAMQDEADRLRATPEQPADADTPGEIADLLEWLLEDNLVLLGWRAYDARPEGDTTVVSVAPGTGLGILRDEQRSRFATPRRIDQLGEGLGDRLAHAPLLRMTRTGRRATVHRLRPMLDLVLTWRDDEGHPVRIERVLGLFTASGLGVPASRTPVLRDRLRRVLELEDVVPGSHEEITLVGLFQSLPKDELLELDVPALRDMLITLLDAEEHGRVKAVVRLDASTRTVTVVLAVPRDDYGPVVRERVTDVLVEHIGGPVDVDVSMGEQAEVVARFTTRTDDVAAVDVATLEHEVARVARPWLDHLRSALVAAHGEGQGVRRLREVANRLPATYRDRTSVARAVEDVTHLDALLADPDDDRAAWLAEDDHGTALLVAQRGEPLILSDVMPVLESLGLQVEAEHPHRLPGDVPLHLHEFRVTDAHGHDVPVDRPEVTDLLLEALAGRFEVDGLNRLVVSAGVTWREVAIVRAYRRYRRQVGTSYSAEYANAALADHPVAVRAILEVFRRRFDPDLPRDPAAVDAARQEAHAACDAIARLDHDRIVRGVLELVDATLRTTAYTNDPDRGWTEDARGRRVPVLAFKLDPSLVPDLPAPAPHREVFVHSPAVEGVHLRGGEVARGGLRFSDRHDDLRTEILGLMKAQVLKNALIVPTGAKGGFVCKRLPRDRDAARADVQRQYVAFISALLDLTDDVEGDEVVPPPRVVRHDGDDPYLVVAADKGTATFSDVANAVAEERGFWLGDAFASGGSSGYDHKKLGITARGAWTVITRHFAELGIDLQTDPVTVAGVGDMSGDVFGNGMLLSRSLRLVAAFDHRDVFLDPDPDPARSYAERERLFDLPGSSWQDYDREVLSPGGMVVSRDAKSVEPTPEVRELLGLDAGPIAPDALMRAVLRCQVDLLWFGGIGTYVKSSHETDADVGDRVNDDVRVDASDVRARVVGEGANLGVTPRGRIQYARRGGRIDQDAVHNAAGVDISDHEVNLKILLGIAEADGRLDRPARNQVLADVSRDVVTHVLRDVDRQAAQLSRLAASSQERLDDLRTLVDALEARGIVDRDVDVLPTHDDFEERASVGAGLTRPELATLMAGAKRVVSETVRASTLPDDPVVAEVVGAYLPARLRDDYGDLVPRHRLHRELVATIVANDLVDRLGPVWPFHLADETGSDLDQVVAATLAAWHVVDATRWWSEMDAVDSLLPPERTQPLATSLARLVMGVARRMLDDPLLPHVEAVVRRDEPAFAAMRGHLPRAGTPAQVARRRAASTRLVDDLVEPSLADLLTGVVDLGLVVDVSRTTRDLGVADAAAVHDAMLRVAARLGLDRLEAVVDRVGVGPGWDRRERKGLAADVQRLHAAALRVGAKRAGADLDEIVEAAVDLDPRRLARVRELLNDVETLARPPLAAVSVVVRAYGDLLDPRA